MKKNFSLVSGKTRWIFPFLIAVFLILGIGTTYLAYQVFFSEPVAERVFPKYSQPKDMATAELDKALQSALQRHPDVLAYLIYRVSISHVTYLEDKTTALLWLSLFEKETDTLVPAEPGLAIANRGMDGTWTVTVQTDSTYNTLLENIPISVLDEETRKQYLSAPQALSKGVAPLRGYRLPWQKGVTKFLTGSVGHVFTYKSCPSSCMYAFDFADGGNFPIMAAKGGIVKYAVWKYPDNNHSNANYIVLEDRSTNPVTFQVYFHLSQDSIPAALRTPGAWVNQGQFIGNVDNTGYSSGPHLHFHVHANPTSFWGNSVDIVFEDVSVNGGRPRTCTEAAAFPAYGNECMPGNKYVSNNGDSKPPTGVLSAPTANTQVTNSIVSISGYGSDASGVAKIQPMVNYDGIWRPAGSAIISDAFLADLDLCAAGVPDGPLSIGLDIWDNGGNKTTTPVGEVNITKKFACPIKPPACSPTDDQVALYNLANYQGFCELLSEGSVANMADISNFGDNNVESIQIGRAVSAILFDGTDFSGRTQSLNTSSPDLVNQIIGANKVSSIKVVKVLPIPIKPVLNPVSAPNGAELTTNDSAILSWQPSSGAMDYRAELKNTSDYAAALDWQPGNTFAVGSLTEGTYQWIVYARNSAGEKSTTGSFVVQPGKKSEIAPLAAPYEFAFDKNAPDWEATGKWQRSGFKVNGENQTGWIFGSSSSYKNGDSAASGDLTSPPIYIGYKGQQFTFRYVAKTESPGPVWDQRRVQISVDNQPFQELSILTEDQSANGLIESKPLDLTPYTGKTVQFRFHFDTIDAEYNDGLGWAITAMRVTDNPSAVCAEFAADDTPESASAIKLGSAVENQLCPIGDSDYFTFAGVKDQQFTANLNITSPVNGWKPALVLIGADGKTKIVDGQLNGNSVQLSTTLPETTVYFLKTNVTPPANVSIPGINYRLSLIQDTTPPTIKLTKPVSGDIPQTLPISLAADASDGENPVRRVEFYFQPAGGTIEKADRVSVDENGADGWTGEIPSDYSGHLSGGAIFSRAFDMAGNHADSTALILAGESNLPTTRLDPLPPINGSTMIHLKWSASSNQKIDHFELQYQQNGAKWQAWAMPLAANLRETSFFAKNGMDYGFRIRAVTDTSAEDFPAEATAVTKVEDQCAPDKFEPADNLPTSAAGLETGGGQLHNICSFKDEDWSAMLLQGGKSYTFTASPQGLPAGVSLQLFDINGNPLSDEVIPESLSSPTRLDYQPETSATYLLRARAADDHLAGTNAIYNLSYDQSAPFSPFPVVCGAALIPLLTALFKLFGSLKTRLRF